MIRRRLSALFSRARRAGGDEVAGRRRPHPAVVYPDDTFLVSYPRSGNAWLRRLVAALQDPRRELGVDQIQRYVPDIYVAGEDLERCRRPRILKSHEPYIAAYPKVVYLLRDGRDVAVSYYNFVRTLRGYGGTFEDFIEDFLSGRDLPFGSWAAHVDSWTRDRDRGPFLLLRYERLHTGAGLVLAELAQFLGLEVTEHRIATALEKCSFEAHREDIRRNRASSYSRGYRGGVAGTAGRWVEHFTAELLDRFWSEAGGTMERVGYRKDGGR